MKLLLRLLRKGETPQLNVDGSQVVLSLPPMNANRAMLVTNCEIKGSVLVELEDPEDR